MKRSAGIWAFKYALWLLFLLLFLLLIVLPLVTSVLVTYLPNVPAGFSKYLRTIESLQGHLLQFLTAAWFFYVGSCIASFLNVVAWRVPRGRNILGSSHCPHCNTKLTFRDNIPIVGWLKNNGQCRICKAPITSRYLLVEILLGAIFLSIVLLSLVSGGINLPLRSPDAGTGFERVLFDPHWDLIQLVIHHLTLLSLLFTFALVRYEGKRIPASIFLFGVLFGLIYTFAFPAVQLVHWRNPSSDVAGYATFEINQVVTLLLGTFAGAACGWILDVFEQRSIHSSICSLVLCGLFLGWQSAISICLIVLFLEFIFTITSDRYFGYCQLSRPGQILVGTIVHLFFWRLFTFGTGYWPNHDSSVFQIVLAFGLMVGLAYVNGRLGHTNHAAEVSN